MNKMKSFTGAALVSALLATSAFASTVAVNPALQRDLPRPDTVVAPSNLPRQYLGTTVKLQIDPGKTNPIASEHIRLPPELQSQIAALGAPAPRQPSLPVPEKQLGLEL